MMGQPPLRWGPDIRPDDGRLDVCIVRARTVVDYLGLLWHVVRGSHKQSPNVRYEVASRSVVIEAKHPLPVQADGEILGKTPVRIEVVPLALKIVVPASAEARSTIEAPSPAPRPRPDPPAPGRWSSGAS